MPQLVHSQGGSGLRGSGAERKSPTRRKSLPSFIGKASVRQRPPINRQAKRPKALTGFQTADIRKCERETERESVSVSEGGRSAVGGARRTCPFSLARGYRHGNWKRHFGRHHNLKLKCAASGEGSRGAEERGGEQERRGSQSQTNLHTGSGVLAPCSPRAPLEFIP